MIKRITRPIDNDDELPELVDDEEELPQPKVIQDVSEVVKSIDHKLDYAIKNLMQDRDMINEHGKLLKAIVEWINEHEAKQPTQAIMPPVPPPMPPKAEIVPPQPKRFGLF